MIYSSDMQLGPTRISGLGQGTDKVFWQTQSEKKKLIDSNISNAKHVLIAHKMHTRDKYFKMSQMRPWLGESRSNYVYTSAWIMVYVFTNRCKWIYGAL